MTWILDRLPLHTVLWLGRKLRVKVPVTIEPVNLSEPLYFKNPPPGGVFIKPEFDPGYRSTRFEPKGPLHNGIQDYHVIQRQEWHRPVEGFISRCSCGLDNCPTLRDRLG